MKELIDIAPEIQKHLSLDSDDYFLTIQRGSFDEDTKDTNLPAQCLENLETIISGIQSLLPEDIGYFICFDKDGASIDFSYKQGMNVECGLNLELNSSLGFIENLAHLNWDNIIPERETFIQESSDRMAAYKEIESEFRSFEEKHSDVRPFFPPTKKLLKEYFPIAQDWMNSYSGNFRGWGCLVVNPRKTLHQIEQEEDQVIMEYLGQRNPEKERDFLIETMSLGLHPIAMFSDGKIFSNAKIDSVKRKTINRLQPKSTERYLAELRDFILGMATA